MSLKSSPNQKKMME